MMESGDFLRFTEITTLSGNPATAAAGVFHRIKLGLTDMGDRNIFLTAEDTVQFFNTWAAEMTRIISHSAATLTCMGHNRPPLKKDLWRVTNGLSFQQVTAV
jgi:hypothetical protein